MSEPFVTIVNGAAGGGRCKTRWGRAGQRLRDAGLALDVRVTERAGHATELAAQAYADGHRRFLAVGGDGTSYEIVNGLFPRAAGDDEKITLGMLPLGTGNSFLRDFDIKDEESALSAITGGKTRSVDVVRAEHADGVLHYINLLGLGFTAQAGALTNDRFKPLGAAGYIAAVLVSLANLKFPIDPIRVRTSDHEDGSEADERPAALLSFSNSRYTGGAMMMAPTADVTDGYLDVIRVGKLGRGPFIATFPKIFAGTHTRHPAVEASRARHVEFLEPRAQPVMVDGEIITLTLKSLEVLPGAIEVFG